MSDDLTARAREIAAGLTSAQQNAVRLLDGKTWRAPAPSHRTYAVLRRFGVLPERTEGFQRGVFELTDLGRGVAAVLAEGGGR